MGCIFRGSEARPGREPASFKSNFTEPTINGDTRKPQQPMTDPAREAYDAMARHYDARWGRYLDATVGETLARIDLRPGDRILDLGCGTGHLLEGLARGSRNLPLAGVDLSAGMLSQAQVRLPPSVELVQGRVSALPFASGSFDLVVSSSSLHFWRRPEAALREAVRILRPGGRLVISDWCRDFWIAALRELYIGRLDPAHHRTYTGKELRGMLERTGLRVERIERYRALPTWGMMTARAVKGVRGG